MCNQFSTIDHDLLTAINGAQAAGAAPAGSPAPTSAPGISDAEMTRNNDLTAAAQARWQKAGFGFCGEFFKKASELAVTDPNVAKLQAQTGIDCLGGLPKG